jgi:hypothetical protein
MLVTGGLEFLAELTGTLDTKRKHAAGVVPALIVVGVTLGSLSAFLFPTRILPTPPISGLSLVITPALLGLAMHLVGQLRNRAGRSVSHLATWYGGAALGAGLAVARFVLLTSR